MKSRPGKLLRDKILGIRLNKFQHHRLFEISLQKKTTPSKLVRNLVIDLIKAEANQSAN